MPSLIQLLYWLLLFSVFIIGVIRYKKLTVPFKILTWSGLVALILTILSRVCYLKYGHNKPLIHLECITEYIFYGSIYYYLFKSRLIKRIIIISIGLAFAFSIIEAVILQPFTKEFPSYLLTSTQALYAIFSILLFREMLLYPLNTKITKQSIFWYNTAMLFNSTTLFIITYLPNYFAKHDLNDQTIYYIWYFILFAFHILIGISLLTKKKSLARA